MNWFRFHTTTLNNPKAQRLPDRLFKTWVNLLCIASECSGVIPDDPVDLAFQLRQSETEVTDALAALIAARLIDRTDDGTLAPHDWNVWQYQSDSSTERVKRFRKRRGNVTVTVPEQSRTDTDTESEQSRPESVQKIFGETSARLRSPGTQPGPDFSDPANRKAAWEQKAFKAVRASLPDPEATALIAGYIDGDRSAVSRVNAIERTAKNGAHC